MDPFNPNNVKDSHLLNIAAKQSMAELVEHPALHCNQFFLIASPDGIRLVFAEKIMDDSKVVPRTAVMLPAVVAKALAEQFPKFIDQVTAPVSQSQNIPLNSNNGKGS